MSRRAQSSLLAAAVLLGAACRTVAPTVPERIPDALAPPLTGPALAAGELKAARSALAAAAAGDLERVRRRLAKLPAGHPVVRLITLDARFVRGEAVGDDALGLATGEVGYASAWSLAALALHREGRLAEALVAARRAAELRTDAATERSAAAIEAELVSGGVGAARALLARGDPAGALGRARAVLELVPGAEEARLVAIRAALAAGQAVKAAELLGALPDSPRGLEAKGSVAEALGQWELAATFYEALPPGHPGRCELLAGAREQGRVSLAPPYVSRALGASTVTRRSLAAILAWEVPSLAAKATGAVPVFEDVVAIPEGRDIVVAARAGVLRGDAIARRFHPDRTVTERELTAVLERLAGAVGAPAPTWCDGESSGAGECLARPATLDGKTVAHLVRSVGGQEETPCIRP